MNAIDYAPEWTERNMRLRTVVIVWGLVSIALLAGFCAGTVARGDSVGGLMRGLMTPEGRGEFLEVLEMRRWFWVGWGATSVAACGFGIFWLGRMMRRHP